MHDVRVSVEVDPDDVLEEMDLDDIVDYLKGHFGVRAILKELQEEPDLTVDLENSYWHGDFNISALLKKLGPEETKKIFQETLSQ